MRGQLLWRGNPDEFSNSLIRSQLIWGGRPDERSTC